MNPPPSAKDPIADISVDPEIGREGVSYTLSSGAEGTVHIEQALDCKVELVVKARDAA